MCTFVTDFPMIASAKDLAKVAGKGLTKAMGKSLPIFSTATLAYGLVEDWYSYNGNNMWYAMGLTLIGAALPVLGTAFIVGTLGATTMGLVFGTTSGIALTFVIPDLKGRIKNGVELSAVAAYGLDFIFRRIIFSHKGNFT